MTIFFFLGSFCLRKYREGIYIELSLSKKNNLNYISKMSALHVDCVSFYRAPSVSRFSDCLKVVVTLKAVRTHFLLVRVNISLNASV